MANSRDIQVYWKAFSCRTTLMAVWVIYDFFSEVRIVAKIRLDFYWNIGSCVFH